MAQLVAHHTGSVGVTGSNPVSSTAVGEPVTDAGGRLSGFSVVGSDVESAPRSWSCCDSRCAAKVVSYTQGFHEIAAGSAEYEWNIDLAAVAAIWRGGCIIRAAFLDRIREAYTARPELPSLLADSTFAQELAAAQDDWRAVVTSAIQHGVPAPGFATALAYYDSLRADRLPAALIQGQRDYFGAHTYRRTDQEGVFHTLWAGDRSEVRA